VAAAEDDVGVGSQAVEHRWVNMEVAVAGSGPHRAPEPVELGTGSVGGDAGLELGNESPGGHGLERPAGLAAAGVFVPA
jgi:hypothetical protein